MALSNEHIVIAVTGTVDLSGYRLHDRSGLKFTFPSGFVASGEVRVHTRAGANAGSDLFMGYKRSIWNAGDIAMLRDARGKVVSSIAVS